MERGDKLIATKNIMVLPGLWIPKGTQGTVEAVNERRSMSCLIRFNGFRPYTFCKSILLGEKVKIIRGVGQ